MHIIMLYHRLGNLGILLTYGVRVIFGVENQNRCERQRYFSN